MICEAFNCPPDVAERQDWQTVNAVMDYRTARAAKDAADMKDKKAAAAILADNPGMILMMGMMNRAQGGRPLHGGALADEGAVVIASLQPDDPDDEE